jgi:hypothetical protein
MYVTTQRVLGWRVRCVLMMLDAMQCDTIRYDTIRYDTIRYDSCRNCNNLLAPQPPLLLLLYVV